MRCSEAGGNGHVGFILQTAYKYGNESAKGFPACGFFSKQPRYVVGSSLEDIREAIGYGVIKMNIDTDTQWATWEGVLNYYKENEGYLQSQLGNPKDPFGPNKAYYDPRAWLRKGQVSLVDRVLVAFEDLNAMDRN